MKKITILLTLLPLLCFAQIDEKWRLFDKDNNNELNYQEFSELRIAQYAELDVNGDSQWARREFVKREDNMAHGRIDSLRGKFKRWDKNDDGLWSIEEAEKAIIGNFRWLDKNRDRSLSINEFPAQF
ncbi:MAG: hypothetical protein CBD32_02195 [Actinobacteria bacterium TMED172]|nr:hypothetical protein [Cellvibrionales bacterium]OUW33288.1 MAG: hypothetical protein CBD32_02195 [Actinobacteria bacterium TMED172]|tara:strand:- start:1772 stop:2152 length:381 start_codon:yes stop_codon:yes gene_type:complete